MKYYDSNYQIFNQNYKSKFLLLCDHATNRIPQFISKTQLGLSNKELNQHISYDIGAKELALKLAEYLRAPLVLSNFSRLVIDPNRSTKDPTSIMQIYDGTIISGNRNLSKKQVKDRKINFYDVYHEAISRFIKNNSPSCIVSIHSFTPQLNMQPPRPWHVGVLWNKDRRMSDLVINEFMNYKEVCLGKNKPYSGNLNGDTLSRHGTSNNLLQVLLEVRNDLINDSVGQEKWAQTLGIVLKKSIKNIGVNCFD